ncbi:Maintenance of telomere capping protein 1, Mtc1 [Ceraceosorus bombacis]|uniref:Maintenance of telomere capping protein 1, Mtc1 n=1 Tax=Ceraceosorus bombacis TaxID=401625 RepID=A0A0P1BFS3_9BASI|nr:Maintenance of telomere capping protein 1, Mtc1 [Ceraceosorus bombacis]
MSASTPTKSKPKTKAADSVEALLSSLDVGGDASMDGSNAAAGAKSSSGSGAAGAGGDAQSLLDEMDDLVQRRGAGSTRKASALSGGASTATSSTNASSPLVAPPARAQAATPASAATSLAELEKRSAAVSAVPGSSESIEGTRGRGGLALPSLPQLPAGTQEAARELQSRGWGIAQGVRGFVKDAGLEKLGEDLTAASRKGWLEIINAVAPPISEHEVIQVTLSHDMIGYDGIADVVFKVLQSVMEAQMDRGTEQQLVVNKAPEPRPSGEAKTVEESSPLKQATSDSNERDFRAVIGWDQAREKAENALAKTIASHSAAPPATSSLTVPITHCPVFVRIQPVLAPLPIFASTSNAGISKARSVTSKENAEPEEQLWFLLLLQDPGNGCRHTTVSQSVPRSWLDVPFEENAWVEQSLVDVLQNSLSVIGQAYVVERQTGRSRTAQALQGAEAKTQTASS